MDRLRPLRPLRLYLALTLHCGLLLASCNEKPRPAPPIKRLASDVHVSIAGHALTLPFAALEEFAYRSMSFSLDRTGDQERAKAASNDLLLQAGDTHRPMPLSGLSVVVRAYGLNDADVRQRAMCPLLSREWARYVCDNAWAAVVQALPANRFRLLDLGRLTTSGTMQPFNCMVGDDPFASLPKTEGEAAIVCGARIVSSRDNIFHLAIVRIEEDLGAVWVVWSDGKFGETT